MKTTDILLASYMMVLSSMAPAVADVLTFEGFPRGQEVYSYNGVGIAVNQNNSAIDVPMVYDTSCAGGCTGFDFDLQTPGYHPSNTGSQGNALILSEDGDSIDPDDSASGGFFEFTFPFSVSVHSVTLIDIEESGGIVSDGLDIYAIPPKGDNSLQRLDVGGTPTTKLTIYLAGSGAIDDIKYTPITATTSTTTSTTTTTVKCHEGPILDDPAVLKWGKPKPGKLPDRLSIHGRVEPLTPIDPEGGFQLSLSNPDSPPFVDLDTLIIAKRNKKSWKSIPGPVRVQVKRRIIKATGRVTYAFKVVAKTTIGHVASYFVHTLVTIGASHPPVGGGCIDGYYNAYWSGEIGKQLKVYSF